MMFDVANPPTVPDSEAWSDLSRARRYRIASGRKQEIAPGDWVDLIPGSVREDKDWQYQFQVCNTLDLEIEILMENDSGEYEATTLSPIYVLNNYRNVPWSNE